MAWAHVTLTLSVRPHRIQCATILTYIVVINVLFARALQAHIPSSAPIVISAVDPGLCHSDLRRRIGESHMTELLKRARTAEEGSRQLLYASLGPDATNLDSTELTQPLRGGYVEDQEASSPSPWATSEDGAKLQARIWVRSMSSHSECSRSFYVCIE